MIADLGALFYLESRQIVNRIRETLRQPGRALMYLFVVGYFVVVALARRRGHMVFPISTIPEPYASTLFFAYITLLGIMMYGAASGIVGAFASPADARFLSGSHLSQRAVILWLQLRRSGTAIVRMLFTLLLYTLIFSSSGTFAGIGLAMIGGTIIAAASAVPTLKLRRIVGTRTAQSMAGALAALGILPMTILLTSLPPSAATLSLAHAIERFGAGYAFNALFDGNAPALIALYAAGVFVIAFSYASGTGLYPELYASSMRVLDFHERQRRGSAAGFAIEHRYEQRAAKTAQGIFNIFRGPWIIVWKEWIAFERSPSMQRLFVFGLIVCAAVGALFGHIAAGSENRIEETVGLASMAGMMIMTFVAMGSAIGLSSDISKPLWWMGRDPLWTRLFAWIVGTSWRFGACLGIGIAAWAIAMRAGVTALAGIPIALTVVLHLRAVGLALYSLFPSNIDQRGPLAMIRALLTFLFAAPPGIIAILALLVLRSIGIGLAAGIIASLLETALLVAFSARRIAGAGVAFARAESA